MVFCESFKIIFKKLTLQVKIYSKKVNTYKLISIEGLENNKTNNCNYKSNRQYRKKLKKQNPYCNVQFARFVCCSSVICA